MVDRTELLNYLKALLNVEAFNDYAPNGLQVEGAARIEKIVTGVTASKALIEAAIKQGADTILVHHGYFWQNEDARIIGMKKQRIQLLMQHDINLIGYHLPLDAHPTLGNNAQLAKLLEISIEGYAGKGGLVAYGSLKEVISTAMFAKMLENKLGRTPLVVGPKQKQIKTIAWCTGAAQRYLQTGIDLGVDAFISGEISEQTTHIALENNIVYFAAGHHATERYGVQALGAHLTEKFELTHTFIEIENPV